LPNLNLKRHGACSRNRTNDLLITSQLLYLLSYAGLRQVRSRILGVVANKYNGSDEKNYYFI
jgi:hypothetical protein